MLEATVAVPGPSAFFAVLLLENAEVGFDSIVGYGRAPKQFVEI